MINIGKCGTPGGNFYPVQPDKIFIFGRPVPGEPFFCEVDSIPSVVCNSAAGVDCQVHGRTEQKSDRLIDISPLFKIAHFRCHGSAVCNEVDAVEPLPLRSDGIHVLVGCRDDSVVQIDIHLQIETDLLGIAGASRFFRFITGLVECRQKQSSKDGDDRNHNKKFNKRE